MSIEQVDGATRATTRSGVRGSWLACFRMPDGSVVLNVQGSTVELAANDWASVVASLSEHGDTARAFSFVERFHDGKWTEAKGSSVTDPLGEDREVDAIEVTVRDLKTNDVETVRVPMHDYFLLCTGDCHVSNTQAYPKSGTHVLTLKGRK